MLGQIITLTSLGDDRGGLVVVEAQRSVPFDIQRVYYIYGTGEGVERGFHAHKELKQVAVAISGSCEMILDDGAQVETVVLDAPDKGILIEPGIWHYMRNFSADCVLLVFADAHYDESDYIRSYEEFKTFIKVEKK